MMKRIFFLFLAIQLLFSLETKASHSVGGEMSVTWISGDDYQITVKVYRDCINGLPQLDDPLIVSVFDAFSSFQFDILIPNPIISIVPVNPSLFCLGLSEICVQEGIYQTTHSFPQITGGYVLATQRCCRTDAIINLASPGATGTTLTQTIPDAFWAVHNSSPTFNSYPPIVICVNQQLTYNLAATDVDGDSLAYRLNNPFAGLSTSNPGPGTSNPPPFPLTNYTGTFTYLNPINSSPAISINPLTGILTLTPTQLGQFVIGISCKEFRNGHLVGTHYLDFQFNVIQCGVPLQSNFSFTPLVDSICQEQIVTFVNTSCGADSFLWDFDDGTFSNAVFPSHLFPSPGIYHVLLTAFGSSITDTTVHTIIVMNGPVSSFSWDPGTDTICNSQQIYFMNHSCTFDSVFWDFDDGTTSTDENLLHQFSSPGVYHVTLIAFHSALSDTSIHTIIVVPAPDVSFTFSVIGHTIYYTNTSSASNSDFTWHFGDGITSQVPNPHHAFQPPYNYTSCLEAYDTITGCHNDTCMMVLSNGITSQNISQQIISSIIGNSLIIKSDLLQHENKIRIFNSLGQEISLNSFSKTEKQISFSISSLPSGIYFIEITNAEEHAVGKFLKE